MKRSATLLVTLTAFCILPSIASAGESNQTTGDISNITESDKRPPKWRVFGGFAAGSGWVSSGQEYTGTPNGSQILLSARLSYQLARWEMTAGVGWLSSQLGGYTSQGETILIKTRSGYSDLSARYRFNDHWQLGPVIHFDFGTDTTASPVFGNPNLTAYAGLQGVYEFLINRFPMQLWSQVSTDISLPSRQTYIALVGVQIGLPINGFSSSSHPSEYQEQPIHITSAAPERKAEEVRVSLDPKRIFFGTGSPKLKNSIQDILKQVGAYLRDSGKGYESADISGHADQRGRFKYNLKLSQKRADTVRDALISGGAAAEKLRSKAFSYLHPLDHSNNPDAWAKNRRVEIVFNNVADPGSLRKILKPLLTLEPDSAH